MLCSAGGGGGRDDPLPRVGRRLGRVPRGLEDIHAGAALLLGIVSAPARTHSSLFPAQAAELADEVASGAPRGREHVRAMAAAADFYTWLRGKIAWHADLLRGKTTAPPWHTSG